MTLNELMAPINRIQWLSSLVRLEIVLWERIDTRLKEAHDLPLVFFESLYCIQHAPGNSLRVGEIAQTLNVTVGGMSKLIDRLDRAGLIQREPDPLDRRASRVALTQAGESVVTAASATYEVEMARLINPVLSANEQRHMQALISRLLATLRLSQAIDDVSDG